MAGASYSNQSSTGSGYSTSSPVQTPQSEWGMQLSKLLSALGQNQYNWAMDQFNTGMGITNQNINQYMDLAGKGAGLAQNLLSRYKDVFEPLMDQFIQQAGSYASEGRQRFMAGQAESTVAQADQQARDEAERKLQGFGINPNSGRYQDLLMTSRIQDAAARAGAGTQASLNTADRGRQMLQQAATMGQNVPGMTVNALQSAYTGITGAENAILGMLNTGSNLTQSAAPFFNAASGAIKNPSQGSQAKNQQQSQGRSVSSQTNPSQNGGDKGQRQPQQQQQGSQGKQDSGQPGAGDRTIKPSSMQNPYYQQPGAGVIKANDGTGQDDNGEGNAPYAAVGSPSDQPYFDQNGVITPMGDPNLARDANGEMQTPQNAGWDQREQVQNWAPQNLPDFQPQGASTGNEFNVDKNAYSPGAWDPTSINSPQPQNQSDPWGGQNFAQNNNDQGNDVTGSVGQNDQQYQQPDQGYSDSFDTGQQGGDYQQPSGGGYQGGNQGGYTPQQQQDASGGYQQQGSGYSGGGYYARGGKVRGRQQRGVLPTSGGGVPRSASPSGGRQTDDVAARLNAGEFVVPRDVVAHQGTKFFQNLIKRSRMARTGMSGPPAQGKMKPSLPNMGQPSFVSRRMGA